MQSFTSDELRRMLPHRHPFLMLDRVLEVEPKVSGLGLKNISIADPVFAGHFPELSIYPGVLLIEASAHVCGIVETAGQPGDGAPSVGFLAGVRKFVFKNPVLPGDQVKIRVQRKAGVGALYEYDCTLTVENRVVATGAVAIATQSV
ncbi:MAG: 3-hydroxyacyl-ACP dehydratase FabZ [Propionibacteriaceae bacterium]|jgi:3-hydroxyacyl-[acyl-carrier-protein] dehydratase|nr:3-hydroxyacyl-ACP dehydratase FabZ [Propionibacteriaceae bacterium]